ncbi:hypothetical protein [Pseudarthrobacter sp. PvP090]|uniref:hypothetical protein n=1 Tax=Pseudarthrobacter sp. PvP090 TaxID=3156393 RepID=UPI0033981B6D
MADSATAGLVPGAVNLDGLTEIRVHGVGGTPPEDLLGDLRPTRVAGDRIAGFYRTSDARGRHREAYSWGGLTSHSPLRVLWTPLLPSMLANMAGWMARRRVMSGDEEATAEPTTTAFRWFARLAALALTLSTAVMVTMPSLDTFAYQCLGQQQCRSRLWGEAFLDVVAPYDRPGVRLAAGIIAPVSVAVLFYVLASRSRTSYEGVEPPAPGTARPVPYGRCAAAQPGGLRSADFWSGRRWHQHLSELHLAAGLAVAAGTLGWCVSELGGRADLTETGAPVTARAASAAAAVVIAAVIVMLAWDEAHELPARGTLYASIGALLAAVAGALTLPLELHEAGGGTEAVTQPAGVLPGIVSSVAAGWTLTLVLLVPLMIQLLAAWIIRWRNALTVEQRGPGRLKRLTAVARGSVSVFPWAAPVVLNVAALILANAVLLSLMMVVADGLGTVAYGPGPQEGGGAGDYTGPVLWVPKTVASIASILALGLIGVLALFAAAAGVWLSVTSRQRAVSLVAELQRDYDAAEAALAGPPAEAPAQGHSTSRKNGDVWTVSAFDPAPFSRRRAATMRADGGMRPSPWVRKVARMRLIGEYAPTLAAYLMIAVAGAALLGAALFVTQVFVLDQDPPFLNIGVATWISASLPIVYGVVLRIAFRQEKWRKVLLSPFDVGTFFPRSFHPFAPPSYTERAVPELTRRIWRLHDNQGRVVLTAHSQGSMVAAAALARQSARHEEKTVGLVTLGSPLAKLYRWAFPALVSDGLLQNFAGGRGGIGAVWWRNVYYETDYIGGPVATDDWPANSATDIRLVDPPTDKFVFAQPLPRILSHTGYWVDARFWHEVDSVCDAIAADTVASPRTDTIAPDPGAPLQYR